MKYYFILFLIFIACTCSAQIDSLNFTEVNRKGSVQIFKLLSVSKKHPEQHLSILIDSNTTKISSVIPHPTLTNTYFIYLENAKRIQLLASATKNGYSNCQFFINRSSSWQETEIKLSPDIRGFLKQGENVSLGRFEIENESIKFSILDLESKQKKSIIVYNKKPAKLQIVEAGIVEVFKKPKVLKLEKNEHGDTTRWTEAISWKQSMLGTNVLLSVNRNWSYQEIVVKPVDNIFLYKVAIERRQPGIIERFIYPVNWEINEKGNYTCRLEIDNLDKVGKYRIILFPKIGDNPNFEEKDVVTEIKFELSDPTFFSSLKNVIIFSIVILCLLVLIFLIIIFYFKRRAKRKLAIEQLQKSQIKTQLNNIHLQLNPHFMFNAMAGIQSLMNENKVVEANRYLHQFSRLTRNVLDKKELVSLQEERGLLKDYLEMEQQRFGFNFEVLIEPEVDLNVEIPVMLLQPFIENAIKHAISARESGGKIIVSFSKKNENLVLGVKDNGFGFDLTKEYQGLGIKLSKDKIALLNSFYKLSPIKLELSSTVEGTEITIVLQNWLS